eukprot:9866628-Heterocapsa_arctica.AAC.1
MPRGKWRRLWLRCGQRSRQMPRPAGRLRDLRAAPGCVGAARFPRRRVWCVLGGDCRVARSARPQVEGLSKIG